MGKTNEVGRLYNQVAALKMDSERAYRIKDSHHLAGPCRLDVQKQQAARIGEKFDQRASLVQLPIERAREEVQTKVRILRLNTFAVGEFDLKALEPSS